MKIIRRFIRQRYINKLISTNKLVYFCHGIVKHTPNQKIRFGFSRKFIWGKILAWVDSAASGLSMQLCDSPRLVTIALDECRFIKPGKEGQLLKIYGKPVKVGNSSITLYLEARSHSVYTGKQTVILHTQITFVRIDDEGNPIPISDRAKNRINQIIEGNLDILDKTI
jgi:acyl-CoA thioesterase YciA